MDDAGADGRFDAHADFPSTFLDNRRTLTVWLPPGHDDSRARFPVLYLHDGQNVFKAARAPGGVSWGAHVTTARLIRTGRLRPVILVGIDNTPQRLDEYAVDRDATEDAGGRGHDYARFVLDEVKPFIDANYRTLPDRRHTGVVGSSLGGLITLSMARLHPRRFALCGVLSPSLWWARCKELRAAEADGSWLQRMRLWLDMGTREGAGRGHVTSGIAQARRLAACFENARMVPGRDYYYQEVAGGEHNEAAWAARFDKVLRFFFGR
jgi:predicted alpha/beta superfamily hydrolase